jgi:hypothetical protein
MAKPDAADAAPAYLFAMERTLRAVHREARVFFP